MERLSLGIEGFDKCSDGGLIKGRTYLVCGEPGSGKTTLGMQYMLNGLKHGEKGLYIAIDEKPEQIIENVTELGWDVAHALQSGSLEFIDMTHYFGNHRLMNETSSTERIVDNIIRFVEEKAIKRLVIDPIIPAIFSDPNNPNIAYFLRRMVHRLESFGKCTALFTSPTPVGSPMYSRSGIEEAIVSGIIKLGFAQPRERVVRTIAFKKMRGSDIDLTTYNFEIRTGTGILLRQPL
ncbi:MAG: MEDS domain-containing protein [bacterium]|nr:MEDS domain-containing protein [bacterium]